MGINLTKTEEQITDEVMSKISLSKDKDKLGASVVNLSKTIVDLSKKANADLASLQAQVVVLLDYSGSMSGKYSSGKVQQVIDKLVPLGLSFDDNGNIEVFRFESRFKQFESLNINNYENYINNTVYADKGSGFGETYYAPVLREIKEVYIDGKEPTTVSLDKVTVTAKKKGLFGKLFGKTETSKEKIVTSESHESTIEAGSTDPVFVIFITDGENFDTDNTDSIIREISRENMFVQFIGIGNGKFKYLRKLDDLSGRAADNTGFTQFSEIEKVDDNTLYTEVLRQFADWLKTRA